jgi:GntR family transcriptional regulator/MocR family aminotransferase
MGDKPFPVSDLLLQLDPASELPMYLQLYEQLRAAIVNDCRIPRSAKLPSTRALSETLRVSRNTVIGAFEQLLAEGYLEGRIGSGTYVAHALPEACLGARPQASAPGYARPPARVSARGHIMRTLMPSTNIAQVVPGPTKPKTFRLHAPSFESFPYDAWRKISHRIWDLIRPEMLGYGCPAGWQPLREAVAHYLRAARAVRCDWQQIIITNGAKQAMHLVAQTMTDPGDPVFIEDPSYSGIRIAFTMSGAKMLPVPVDREGLEIATAEQMCPDARLVYVTPSHQYPLGTTMSLNRRLALLDWARRRDGFVIEDDYDSEFRYRGRPLASLQGLDRENRVLYIGTFSKVLMPSLRLGYMVVPPDLVDTFIAARAHYDWSSPVIEQATLAEFMTEGHFARLIRKNRAMYAERQEVLVDAGRRHLRGLLELPAKECGMHLLGWLPKGVDDAACSRALSAGGVESLPLSQFALAPVEPGGLLLGYAPFDRRSIETGVERMAAILEREVAPFR